MELSVKSPSQREDTVMYRSKGSFAQPGFYFHDQHTARYFPSLHSGGIGIKCDSLFHPYAQGPKGENVGSITQPLPSNYLIFRAASESDGEALWVVVVVVFTLSCLSFDVLHHT